MSDAEIFETDIAVIGMSGRFPQSRNLSEWWENLRAGTELVSFYTEEELLAAGVDAALLKNEHYIRAGTALEDAAMFDAQFFGFNPREAEVIDPQQRLFLEAAHEALEQAGYMSGAYDGRIGVYAGESMNTYFLNNLLTNPGLLESVGGYQIMTGNDKDYLPTRVAYKLNLKGPAINVQTACSTSLVAVHMACQSLLHSECDIALAGGVSVTSPQGVGYLYREGMIMSADGYCRPFDANAKGTMAGTGLGVVVLKPLADAIEDGDTIHAVIRGSAINNDGLRKVGYTAPSIEGQAEAIAEAQAMARISAETVSYVEGHGTATPLGDPIEVAALTQAFRVTTEAKQFCALGSVKSNLGHADAAAGVAGLLKTILQLKHKEIVPTLNYEQPNPKIDFASSPFYVNTDLREWRAPKDIPRRAGVSSFGIGGTNAHVVLEEAPEPSPGSKPHRQWQLLTLSAKTETALDQATQDLAAYLKKEDEGVVLADVAYTQHVGRTAHEHRRVAVCGDGADAAAALEQMKAQRVWTGCTGTSERSVVFMFPGQGSQHVGMARELYESEPTFRANVDRCAQLLVPELGCDLRDILYPTPADEAEAATLLTQTSITQPALFVVEYALAQLWLEWGVRPEAMIGHSIGEYVAACLAGVMSLEDALRVVALRGRLMQSLPAGAMLAVPLTEDEAQSQLGADLNLAAINAPQMSVVSGPIQRIAQLEEELAANGFRCQRLRTSHAFHSSMMEPILRAFTEELSRISLQAPRIPFISNVTGRWITVDEATSPQYWARHLRQAVRFSDGVAELLNEPNRVLLEVGPGRTLCSLVRQQLNADANQLVLTSLGHAQDERPLRTLLSTLGRLWVSGLDVSWPGFHAHEKRRRIPIPTYPFERQKYWIEPVRPTAQPASRGVSQNKKTDVADWFYLPSWKRCVPVALKAGEPLCEEDSCWLLFVDECGVGQRLAERLRREGVEVVTVKAGDRFARLDDSAYAVDPQRLSDYEALLEELQKQGQSPATIMHLWSLNDEQGAQERGEREAVRMGFDSLLFLAQALDSRMLTEPIQLGVVSNNIQEVTGEETIIPEKALLLGACTVIPQEYSNITCRRIDVSLPVSEPERERLIQQLIAELVAQPSELVVAYRGQHRWTQTFEAVHLNEDELGESLLKEGGVYLLTGGLGGVGLVLAEYLARTVKARLVLVNRTAFPEREEWENWLAAHTEEDGVSARIRKVQAIEALGAEVMILRADVCDAVEMREAMSLAVERFGHIDGVIHTAGATGGELIQQLTIEKAERVSAAKVKGTRVLFTLLEQEGVDFLALCSSTASVLGGIGQADYSAANAYLDAFAQSLGGTNGGPRVISINWDRWQDIGMGTVNPDLYAKLPEAHLAELKKGILAEEGADAFGRILRASFSQVIVSTSDLDSKIAKSVRLEAARTEQSEKVTEGSTLYPRPVLQSLYAGPRNVIDQALALIWQDLLGIEQVGIHDNFFELGGHSLLGTQLLSRLRDTFKIELPLRRLLEAGTIRELSDSIVADEPQPGRIERIAQVLVMVEEMSDEDVSRRLQEKA
jgi:acyl transferase domain-containing protein/acyl carrier protein